MLRVASSQPASNRASSASVVNSVMPVNTRAKSCSISHDVLVSISLILRWIGGCIVPGMWAKVDITLDIPGVTLRIPWCGPHADDAAFPGAARAKQTAPCMPIGHLDVPTERFRILDG